MTYFQVPRTYKYVATTTIFLLLSTLLTHSVIASINEAFNYQGKLVNDDGTNVTNTEASCISTGVADTCDFRISLYTAASGGTLVWQETKSDVELYDNDSIFNLVLNCGGTFSSCNQNGGPDFTSGQLFLEVEFDPDGDGDFAEGETFDPRREFTAVPYSFNAKYADSADTLDDIDSSSFLRSDSSDTLETGITLGVDGTIDINGNISVDGDITISDEAIVFDGASTEFTLSGDLSINSNDIFVRKSDGYTGIGTTNPNSALEVAGNITIGDHNWLGLDTDAARIEFISNVTNDIISFNDAVAGIGTTNPNAKLEIVDTSTQLRLSYDAGNYTDLTTNVSGYLNIKTNDTSNFFMGIDPVNPSYSDIWAGGVIPDGTNYLMQARNDSQEVWWNVANGGYMYFTLNNSSTDAPLMLKDSKAGVGYDYDESIPVLLSVDGDAYIKDRLGIGTTAPFYELEVLGDAIFKTAAISTDGSTDTINSGLVVDYDSNYTDLGQQLLIQGSVTGAADTNVFGARIEPESITVPAGTTTLAASLYIAEPTVTETGTLTNSATLYIADAADEADNNYALWIDSGAVQIDEDLTVGNNMAVINDIFIGGTDQAGADIYLGSGGQVIVNGQNNNSDFRIDGSGPSLESIFFADADTGAVGIDTSAPTAYLDVPSSDTNRASMRVRTGSTPSSPNEGDIYGDGTDLYYRNDTEWIDLTAGIDLQESYEGGNTIDIASAEGALTFDAVSANFDVQVGEGTDTGDFRIWDGTNNWFLLDEDASSIVLGNADAATSLSLTSGSTWSISSAGAASGFTTLATSDDWTWSASTPTITINSGEVLSFSDGSDSFTFDATDSSFGMSDGSGNSFDFDLDTGPNYSGTARPTKVITLSPEYPGAVLTDFYGAGTDASTSGTMTSDGETTPASNIKSYYSWERNASGQHFYTVAVRVTLPEDFSAWSTSNALVVNYVTESATSTDSDVDVRVYLEGNGTVDASSTNNTSVTWATTSFGSTDLDLWNAAGETAVIYLRLGSASGNFARVGDITLSYLASF